jgi:nitric oxide reductase NorQ protein
LVLRHEVAVLRPARYQATPATTTAAVGGMSTTPAPRPAATAPPPARSGVTRPNGAIYRPRALADMPDTDALRRLRAAGIPALLYGPPGTGKTSLVEAAFGEEVITVAGDGDTAVSDLGVQPACVPVCAPLPARAGMLKRV